VRAAPLACALFLLVGLCFAVGLMAGASGWKTPWGVAAGLLRGDDIIAILRAPRVVLAAIVGASLAVAGVSMQTLLANDVAEPYVLGLSGGASLGAVLSLALFPGVSPGPLAAAGAAGAAVLVKALSRPYHPTRLLLCGIAIGSLLGSATGLVLVLSPPGRLLRSATYWLFGGLASPDWAVLWVPLVVLGGAIAFLLARAERLDRLVLGEDVAASLGVDVLWLRRGVLLLAVCLTASVVAVSGLIGFVGLIAPHVARHLVGPAHRRLVPIAALCGALVVMAADTAARTAFAPREVPVGLVTAVLGGPFFLVLLGRGRA
jgi:iron complex transport system permease protein